MAKNKKPRNPNHSRKLHRLVRQSRFISAYDKNQAFDFVRGCLTPPLDAEVKRRIDYYLAKISGLYASLGTDSTVGDIGTIKALEEQYMLKIKDLAPDYYETIKGNI